MRPRSIILFERLYLTAIGLGAIAAVFSYIAIRRAMPQIAMPEGAPNAASILAGTMIGTAIVSLIVKLLLWFYAARRASNTARWIIVALLGLAMLGLVRSVTYLHGGATVALVVPGVLVAIQALCVWLLFRPDAAAWFRGERAPDNLHNTFS